MTLMKTDERKAERKILILEFLKKGEAPTGKVAAATAMGFWVCQAALEDLLKEKKIISRKEKNAVYWGLKK